MPFINSLLILTVTPVVVVFVTKVTGHVLPVDILVRVGLGGVCDQLQELVRRIRTLRLDASEYTCLKFVILLNPGKTHC